MLLCYQGFERKATYSEHLLNLKGISSIGYCRALLILVGKFEKGDEEEGVFYKTMFSEAAAIPCPGRKGQLITPGSASRSTYARVAVELAVDFVRGHLEELEGLLGNPRVDLEKLVRLREDGSQIDDVDVVLHIPSQVSATFLAPSMVIAIINMLWRRPSCHGWSFVGSFDTEGRLSGYPLLVAEYIEEAVRQGFTTLVAPTENIKQLVESAREHDLDLPKMGMRYDADC